jgi:hypothetical protein
MNRIPERLRNIAKYILQLIVTAMEVIDNLDTVMYVQADVQAMDILSDGTATPFAAASMN